MAFYGRFERTQVTTLLDARGRSLFNLAPKLAIENLKLSFDSLSPSLLPNLVSLFSFSGMRLSSMIGTSLLISLKKFNNYLHLGVPFQSSNTI